MTPSCGTQVTSEKKVKITAKPEDGDTGPGPLTFHWGVGNKDLNEWVTPDDVSHTPCPSPSLSRGRPHNLGFPVSMPALAVPSGPSCSCQHRQHARMLLDGSSRRHESRGGPCHKPQTQETLSGIMSSTVEPNPQPQTQETISGMKGTTKEGSSAQTTMVKSGSDQMVEFSFAGRIPKGLTFVLKDNNNNQWCPHVSATHKPAMTTSFSALGSAPPPYCRDAGTAVMRALTSTRNERKKPPRRGAA